MKDFNILEDVGITDDNLNHFKQSSYFDEFSLAAIYEDNEGNSISLQYDLKPEKITNLTIWSVDFKGKNG